MNYSYNAEGQRIRKAVGSSVEEYVYDSVGHQFAAMQPNTAVTRVELYASARHLATYDSASNATYFIHGDWQGTERMRTSVSGASYETCTNLPFGDAQQCSGGADISPMHFTGKPRDVETNLDYFGARYYNSTMARWMSPDWADKPTAVPYAQFGNPQSLNLYGYVTDNPVSRQDGDGHDGMPPPPEAYGGMAGATLWYSQLQCCGAVAYASIAGQAQQPGSTASNLPVNNNYVLGVTYDSGGTSRDMNNEQTGNAWDVRAVNYSLESAPPPGQEYGKPVDFKTVEISEHQSNPKLASSTEKKTGLFQDHIGPHGDRKTQGITKSDRYFTVTLNGKQLGVIPISDRYGTHVVDHIEIDSQHDTTRLNGHYDPTD